MADSKITALTAISTVDPTADPLVIVDVSDTSMAASGTTKKSTINQLLGSGGTATLASATITGAATVGTTLGVTGVSTLASAVVTGALTSGTTTLVSHAAGYTGKVGIGTATPNNTLTINGTAATWNKGAYIIYSDAGSTYIGGLGNGGSIFGSGTDNDIGITTGGATNLRLGTNNTEQMRITSAGNVNISTGNVVMGTSGKGIDFSAKTPDGSGTVGSEVLNDYEEGTFLPTVIGTTTAGTVTYVRQLGRYTKVGNLVTVQIYLAYSGGTGTGDLAFGGLPFAIAGNANEYASAAIGQLDNIALTALNVPSIVGSPNATFFNLNQFPVGGGAGTGVAYDAAGAIIMTSTYIV